MTAVYGREQSLIGFRRSVGGQAVMCEVFFIYSSMVFRFFLYGI